MARLYHRDGRACAGGWSCGGAMHTSVPPVCGAAPTAQVPEAAGVARELPMGHPGPRLHAATGCEY